MRAPSTCSIETAPFDRLSVDAAEAGRGCAAVGTGTGPTARASFCQRHGHSRSTLDISPVHCGQIIGNAPVKCQRKSGSQHAAHRHLRSDR